MAFYHELITEQSWVTLQALRRQFTFTLIGGWAVYLYTQALKSKDIDLVVDYPALEQVRRLYELRKNDRLKKYEIKIANTDVDLYLPWYSRLGFPLEELNHYRQSRAGFSIPTPAVLLLMKVAAAVERQGTTKGRKDVVDIFSLLSQRLIDWGQYQQLVTAYRLRAINDELTMAVRRQRAIPELNLLNHRIARLKKEVLRNLSPRGD